MAQAKRKAKRETGLERLLRLTEADERRARSIFWLRQQGMADAFAVTRDRIRRLIRSETR